jgi:hypothetical protein
MDAGELRQLEHSSIDTLSMQCGVEQSSCWSLQATAKERVHLSNKAVYTAKTVWTVLAGNKSVDIHE